MARDDSLMATTDFDLSNHAEDSCLLADCFVSKPRSPRAQDDSLRVTTEFDLSNHAGDPGLCDHIPLGQRDLCLKAALLVMFDDAPGETPKTR
jgi:hypothetical protein